MGLPAAGRAFWTVTVGLAPPYSGCHATLYVLLSVGDSRSTGALHAQGEKANGQSGEEGDEEQKRMARMQRNRESAMLSRQRKKMQLDELDRQNKQLQATNTHLSGAPRLGLQMSEESLAWVLDGQATYTVRHLRAELSGLRHASIPAFTITGGCERSMQGAERIWRVQDLWLDWPLRTLRCGIS